MIDQKTPVPDTTVSPRHVSKPCDRIALVSRRRLLMVLGSVAVIAVPTTRYRPIMDAIVLPVHSGTTPLIIPGKVVRCSDDNFRESVRYSVDDSGEHPVVRTLETGPNDPTVLSVDVTRNEFRSPRASIRVRVFHTHGSVRDSAVGEKRVCSPPSGPSTDTPRVLQFNATSGAAWEARVAIDSSLDSAEVTLRDIELTPAD